jgi:hypothetical protein
MPAGPVVSLAGLGRELERNATQWNGHNMRTGTKVGLILIGLIWLAVSTGISAHFVMKAQSEAAQTKFMDPLRVYRGRVPAGARSQGGLWV